MQEFLDTATAGGVLLLVAVLIALAWSNSPWADTYDRLWETPVSFHLGSAVSIEEDLRFWVNDGLMTIFFFVVGLEIKRELTSGELRRFRAAVVPGAAAIGGMVLPALVYLLVARQGNAGRGWGVPMATDVAFALGVLTLAARHAPPSLKPILLTLAIVDDIGAIVVIAVFYTGGIDPVPLMGAALTLVIVIAAARARVRAQVVYIVLGACMWYLTFLGGIHPTITGVVLGLATPSVPMQRPRAVSHEAHRTADETVDDPHPPDADARWWLRLAWLSKEAVSPMARVEHVLLPWSSFVILPMFALANAGVRLSWIALDGALTNAIGIGIVLGLVIGKPLGILIGSFAATRAGGRLPDDVAWGNVAGMAITAGIGFTVALFIAELAFVGPLLEHAKIAILVGSIAAGVLGSITLRIAGSGRSSRTE